MKTFVFQLEVEIADERHDLQAAVKQVMESLVENLSVLRKPGEDPPFRLSVITLGVKPDSTSGLQGAKV